MVHAVFQADAIEKFGGALAALAAGGAPVDQGQLDIAQSRGVGQQVEALEDEADLVVADVRQFVALEPFHRLLVQPVLARGRGVQAAEKVHQGGLARPGRAEDGGVLAAADRQVDAAQGLDGDTAHGVDFAQFFCFDHFLVSYS